MSNEGTFGRRLSWLAWGYFLCGMAVALLAPIDHPLDLTSTLGGQSPTAITLKTHGDLGTVVDAYFSVMTLLLPVVTCALAWSYPRRDANIEARETFVPALTFFLLATLLVGGVAYLLPPDHDFKGSRARVLIQLASDTRIGLGVLVGALFVVVSILAALTVAYSAASISMLMSGLRMAGRSAD